MGILDDIIGGLGEGGEGFEFDGFGRRKKKLQDGRYNEGQNPDHQYKDHDDDKHKYQQQYPQTTQTTAVAARCPKCGAIAPQNAKFCMECGGEMVKKPAFCMECGSKLPDGAKFCGECGNRAG